MSVISFRHLHNVSTIGSGSVKFKVYAPYQLPQLSTPQNVSASGTTVSWDAVTNATSYEIFAGNTSIATTTSISYNLTNSTSWNSLSDGNYNITIVAKADGYRDSAKSMSVTVTKGGSTGETWVLNSTLNGNFAEQSINFTSDNTSFVAMVASGNNPMAYSLKYKTSDGLYTEVFQPRLGWVAGEAYRTITFETAPTGELLTWLQANGTKQGGATLISFTIDGTSYQAEEGMTWEQWVNSSYNTGGFTIDSGDNTIRNGPHYLYTSSNMQFVLASNTVISGGAYTFTSGGAGQ